MPAPVSTTTFTARDVTATAGRVCLTAMGYEVVVEELRTAAGQYERTVSDLAGYDFEAANVAADTFGHVELAAWYAAVADQCDNAGRALHDGATGLATSLRA